MSPSPEIRGWCPTAYRPMESGDGLLIRAKVIGAKINAAQLRAIAQISQNFGNGLIDLTQRGQFQIRGAQPSTFRDAIDDLGKAGLISANADIERITNILSPPLAGLDKSAMFDASLLVSDLAKMLAQDPALYALPAKFLFAINDDGALPIDDNEADISIHPASESRFAVRLASVEDQAAIVPSKDVIDTVLRLTKAFINLRSANPFDLRRMGKFIEAIGVSQLIERASVSLSCFTPSRKTTITDFLGAHEMSGYAFVGVGAPSGRWRAKDLAVLAMEASCHGLNEVRLTPWRAILLPTPDMTSAIRIKNQAQIMGLIVDSNDPRRSVVACPGSPECFQAKGETRRYLKRLASFAPLFAGRDGVGLHISGCEKGCFRRKSTPLTLVIDHEGLNLVIDGRAQDQPNQSNLTIEEVEQSLTHELRKKAQCLKD